MSRVSEAMRRAGQLRDDSASRQDEPSFASDGDTAETPAPVNAVVPAVDRELSAPDQRPPYYGPQAPIRVARKDGGDDIRIQELLRLLYRRRWMVGVVVSMSLATAIAYNYLASPVYEARARVLIEPTAEEVVPFRASAEDPGRSDYFMTQLDVLRSKGLARKALERLHLLTADPTRQDGQISQFLSAVTISTTSETRIGESRVISVMYRSTDPKLAARVLNGLAQTYVDQNLELRTEGSRRAAEWLNQRVKELREAVSSSDGALQQYREQKDAVSLDDRQNIVVQKFGQLNAAVTSARTDRVQKQTLYEQLVALEKSGAPLDTFPPILSNTFIQGVKAELAGLQREKLQLAERLGELHPDMIKVNSAIQNAQNRLNAETAKVVEGIKNDFLAAQANEQGLASALEAQKREVLNLNQKAIAYNALQRDATSTQQMFNTVLQRAKETELAGELQSNNIKILDAAELPQSAIWPRKQLNLAIALFGGCFLAVCFVFGMEYVSPRIAEPEDIADELGLPLLGVAPRVAGMGGRPATLNDLPFPFQEAIRSIRTRLLLSPASGTARAFAVTSASPGEGKTVLASNLAVAMALAGRRVLLVDADLRRPQLHNVFSISKSPGLSSVITGDARPSEALAESSIKGLFVLPAGADPSNPADMLDSERLNRLVQGFRQVFDVVVMDCPPVMAVADASIVANATTAVIFVVGSGTTSSATAQLAIERLASVQARVVGVVLNKTRTGAHSDYYYKYDAADATA